VLAILAQQRQVISNLNLHADAVLQQLAADRADIGDWVIKARNISSDSAERRDGQTHVREIQIAGTSLKSEWKTPDAQPPVTLRQELSNIGKDKLRWQAMGRAGRQDRPDHGWAMGARHRPGRAEVTARPPGG